MVVRFKCVLAYVGTQYSGWQIQEKPDPPPTIQGELEKVLSHVVGSHVRVHGAGRTDSGVHAEGQVAHWDIPKAKAHHHWQRILNAKLPRDIAALHVTPVSHTFHSRFDALAKTYRYMLWTERDFVPPRLRPFVWDCGLLNTNLMQQALPHLLGSHDFASFQNVGTPMQNTERTIHSISLEHIAPAHMLISSPNALLCLTITADGFLKQMVRNIMGLLVAIGQEKYAAKDIPQLFAVANRKKAPATAPARGLTLHKVFYKPPYTSDIST